MDTGVNWHPPIEIQTFLSARQRPICIGFGSMVDNKPEQIKEIVFDALKHARQRAILVGGWGGLGEAKENTDMIFWIDSVPYDWLFPRVAAVIHHGGAGTTAEVLRAGVPSVVVPFFADQPFWAHRVHKMGLSPQPIPRRSLTSARLTHAIRVAVQDEGLRQRATDMGRRIRTENGVAAAIEAIQRQLETRSRKAGALSLY
jgi:sterol 3beta-glucosyltransferase